MTDMIKWLGANAEFMSKDRPDVWADKSEALEDLVRWVDDLNKNNEHGMIATAGFRLDKYVDPDGDVVEYELSRIISTASFFPKEKEFSAAGWTKGSGTLKYGVDLPDVLDVE